MTRRESIKLGGGTLLALFAGAKLIEDDDAKFERNIRNGRVVNSTFRLRKQHVFKTPVYIEKCTFVAGRQSCFLSGDLKNDATITMLGGGHVFCNNTVNLNSITRFLGAAYNH